MKISNKKVLVASLLIISAIIASFVALTSIPPVRAQTVVRIEPATSDVVVCNNFNVDVVVYDLYELMDWFEVLIFFNPDDVHANLVVAGPDVPPQDQPLNIAIDNVGGSVWAQSNPPVANGFGSPGPVANILGVEFHCEGPSMGSVLQLQSQLFNALNVPIPHNDVNGQVNQAYFTATTYIDPATYTVPMCVPFNVDVEVSGMTNLHSFSLVLTYSDTSCVDCIDIVPGSFLPTPVVDHKLIDDAMGRIEFDVHNFDSVGTSGSGDIARLTFHCTGAGNSNLDIDSVSYWDPDGNPIPTTTMGSRIIQYTYWEPFKLQDLVEWPLRYVVAYNDILFVPPGSPAGYTEVKTELEAKGFYFDASDGTAIELNLTIDDEEYHGNATQWWSSDTLEDGTRACMLSVEMDDGTSMAMGFVTNLLGPEQVPEVDPYIIVNAQPYLFVDFYWWCWPRPDLPLGGIIRWPYWWYDSHSHPNWFWGPYWWWRCYTKAYYLGMPYPPVDINWAYWRPWWGWWWHWVYWRHWYWWSSYFPYDP